MNKKSLFAAGSLFLTLGLIIEASLPPHIKVPFLLGLSLTAGILTIVVLKENIAGLEFFTLTALPVLFTFGMSGILYQFPNFSLFFRFVFWSLYSFFFYIILLSGNIFNVAAEKPIPLVRASYTASFLVTLFTIFPLYTVVFKINPSLTVALLLTSILTFALTFQSLWTVFLPKSYDSKSLWGSVVVTLVMAEVLLALSFMQIESFYRALGLATIYYIVLGFTHHYFRRSLNNKVYLEYLLIVLIVSFIIFLF